jgi:hypothetical protein
MSSTIDDVVEIKKVAQLPFGSKRTAIGFSIHLLKTSKPLFT